MITTLETLRKVKGSLLAAMKFDIKDEIDGSHFLDREPNIFKEVVSYLRSD